MRNDRKITKRQMNVFMRKLRLISISSLLLITGCASNPDSIDAAYVSPLKYSTYSCAQLSAELDYVGQRTNVLYQNLDAKRKGDNWQMGVGLLLFWPTLFALEGGDGADAGEYARLKGEFEALRQTSVQKSCSIAMQSPDEILDAARNGGAQRAESVTPSNSEEARQDLSAQLRELDALFQDKLITEEEYQAARTRALSAF
jgi:hypothetical protein